MGETAQADRTLDVLEAVAAAPGGGVAAVATACGLPFSTTHRLLGGLAARGYVLSPARGRYRLGAAALALGGAPLDDLIGEAARPVLAALSRRCRAHAHLGVFEGDMVTYLVKQPYGRTRLPTLEGAQLEGYCSGIGKVLLAHLDPERLAAYLAEGPFVALTDRTMTDPAELAEHLAQVRAQGWAADRGEIAPGLHCVAAPLLGEHGRVLAALSVSFTGASADPDAALPAVLDAAAALRARLFPRQGRI